MRDASTEPIAVPEPSPLPPVPWNACDIVFLVFFIFLVFFVYFWPSAAFELLRSTGFFACVLASSGEPIKIAPHVVGSILGGGGLDWYYARELDNFAARQHLWTAPLAFPFEVATVLGFAYLLLGVRPTTLGLTRHRLGRNVVLGLGSAALLTPLVVGLHQLIVWLYRRGLDIAEQKHPLARLGEMNLTRLEWGLLLFTAIVAAPVIEELLFRGVFQPAAGKSRWGGLVGMGLAAALTALTRHQHQRRLCAAASARDRLVRRRAPTVLDALARWRFF